MWTAAAVRLVGNQWRRADAPRRPSDEGDEQPLDAAALVEALVEAMVVRPAASAYGRQAVHAFEWFLGRNPTGYRCTTSPPAAATTASGPAGPSENEGAESTLAYLQALLALEGAGLQRFVGRERMRVALLGPIAWRTPPRHYGPWELVTGLLAEGLVARGLDVTLFATLDSLTTAALDGVCPQGYEEDREPGRAGLGGAARRATRFARSAEFDLVHNNLDWLPLAFSGALPGATGDHHPRLLRPADPAGLPRGRLGVRVDLRRRPRAGAGLLRDGVPRHRPRAGSPSRPRRATTW